MHVCNCAITTPRLAAGRPLKTVQQVECVQSVEQLVGTCAITLPRVNALRRQEISKYFRRGDPITVKLGYDGNLRTVFAGTIREVTVSNPAKIMCEDAAATLKDTTVDKTWEDTTLPEVVDALWSGKSLASNTALGKFVINNSSAAFALKTIRDQFQQRMYVRFNGDGEAVLIAGDIYDSTIAGRFDMRYNVDGGAAQPKVQRAEDIRIRVKAVNFKRAGGAPDVTYLGAPEGEGNLRTLNYYDRDNYAELAEAWLAERRFTGLAGDLTVFGHPHIQAGHAIEIIDPEFPERAGVYQVDTRKIRFGVGVGYRQILSLGPKT